MSQIYRQARRVLVWLGDNHDGCEQVIELIKRHKDDLLWLGRQARVGNESKAQRDQEETNRHEETLSMAGRLFGSSNMPNLQTLVSRPWFQRRWVIQEVVLAQEAVVYCGAVSMAAGDFITCTDGLCYFYEDQSSLPLAATNSLASLTDIVDEKRTFNLLHLIYKFHASLCTDDRDRVYALMGLTSENSNSQFMEGGLHGLPGLGYRTSVEEVYRALAVMSTEQLHPINSLCLVLDYASSFPSRDVQDSKVPSWVPDWRAKKRARLILRTPETCHPIGPFDDSIMFEVSDRILRIQGWSYRFVSSRVVVSPVQKSSPPAATGMLSVIEQIEEWWTSYKQVLRDRIKSGNTKTVHHSAAWRAFAYCATRGSFQQFVDPDMPTDGYYHILYREDNNHEADEFTPEYPHRYSGEWKTFGQRIFSESIQRMMNRRALFETDGGGLLVNGPDDTEAGDLVISLPSGAQLILRPTRSDLEEEPSFWLIGDAYIEGSEQGLLNEEDFMPPGCDAMISSSSLPGLESPGCRPTVNQPFPRTPQDITPRCKDALMPKVKAHYITVQQQQAAHAPQQAPQHPPAAAPPAAPPAAAAAALPPPLPLPCPCPCITTTCGAGCGCGCCWVGGLSGYPCTYA